MNANSNITAGYIGRSNINPIDSAVANIALRSDQSNMQIPTSSVGGWSKGIRFGGISQPIEPPKPGPNSQLMYVFWITVLVCMFETAVMFRKYNFVNVRHLPIAAARGLLCDLHLPAQLLRQILYPSMRRAHGSEPTHRLALVVCAWWDVLVSSNGRGVCSQLARLSATHRRVHFAYDGLEGEIKDDAGAVGDASLQT